MEKRYYTLMEEPDGRIWPLSLEPDTKQASQRAISWQHTGGNYQPMHTAAYDKRSKMFVSTEGRIFAVPPSRGVYTEKAWTGFLVSLDPTFAHCPDVNPQWTPRVGRVVVACSECGTEKTVSTNHTGTVWAEPCAGGCRDIFHPNTSRERVVWHPARPHRYVKDAE